MKRWWIVVALTVVVSLGYGYYAAERQHRAKRLRLDFEQTLRQRDFVSAHALMEEYLQICPEDAGAHLLAAQAARRAQFQEEFFPSQTDLLRQANRHLDDCSKLNGFQDAINLERGLLRVQHGDLEGLEESLLAYVQTENPDVPLVLEALVHGFLRALKLDKARNCVDDLLVLQPENEQALVWRGQLKEQFLNFVSARQDFEEAIRLNPGFDSARLCLITQLIRIKRVDDAVEHLNILEERIPQHPLVRLARALCSITDAHPEVGAGLLDDWLKKTPSTHPRRLEALTARARVCLPLDQPMKAQDFALQALRISPCDQAALYILYRSFIAQGKPQEAEKVQTQLERVKKDLDIVSKGPTQIAESPEDLGVRHRLGEAYLRLGRPGEALVWFISVLELDPAYRPTLQALTVYYEHAGDDRKAAEFRQRLATTRKIPSGERLDTGSGRPSP